MAYAPEKHRTPWQKVVDKFGLSPAKLAQELGRDRSKITRHINSEKGLISGRDQELLIAVAKALEVELTPEDLTPEVR